jgi:hypothetical protein
MLQYIDLGIGNNLFNFELLTALQIDSSAHCESCERSILTQHLLLSNFGDEPWSFFSDHISHSLDWYGLHRLRILSDSWSSKSLLSNYDPYWSVTGRYKKLRSKKKYQSISVRVVVVGKDDEGTLRGHSLLVKNRDAIEEPQNQRV